MQSIEISRKHWTNRFPESRGGDEGIDRINRGDEPLQDVDTFVGVLQEVARHRADLNLETVEGGLPLWHEREDRRLRPLQIVVLLSSGFSCIAIFVFGFVAFLVLLNYLNVNEWLLSLWLSLPNQKERWISRNLWIILIEIYQTTTLIWLKSKINLACSLTSASCGMSPPFFVLIGSSPRVFTFASFSSSYRRSADVSKSSNFCFFLFLP